MNQSPTFRLAFILLASTFLFYNCKPSNSQDSTNQMTDVEEKIEQLIGQMTIEEKVNMIHASSPFTSGGVERLGIPEMIMSDGPHGVRH